MNCGGAAGKCGDILALAEEISAEVIFLQELWEAFDPQEFASSGGRIFYDHVATRGASLALLVRHSFLDVFSNGAPFCDP